MRPGLFTMSFYSSGRGRRIIIPETREATDDTTHENTASGMWQNIIGLTFAKGVSNMWFCQEGFTVCSLSYFPYSCLSVPRCVCVRCHGAKLEQEETLFHLVTAVFSHTDTLMTVQMLAGNRHLSIMSVSVLLPSSDLLCPSKKKTVIKKLLYLK